MRFIKIPTSSRTVEICSSVSVMPHLSRPSPSQRTCSPELGFILSDVFTHRFSISLPIFFESTKKILNTRELAAQFTWYDLRGLSGSAVIVLTLLCPRAVQSSTTAEFVLHRTLRTTHSVCVLCSLHEPQNKLH